MSPKVPEEEHCLAHWVMHYPGLFVDSVIDAPTGHEFFHLILISSEDFWFFSDHLVRKHSWISVSAAACWIRSASSATSSMAVSGVISTSTTS